MWKLISAALGMLLIVGFCATVQMAATNTTLQNRVPDHLRGRIMAVYATMFMGIQPIGALLAGGVATWIGAPYTLAVFGTLCFLGSLVFIFRVALPAQRRSEASATA